MKQLQSLNPLVLRAAALTEKLPAYHIGRALFHLNQRRGFKSNRKDRSDVATRGIVSTSSRLLLEQMKLIGPQLSKEEYKALSKEEKMQARTREAENLELAINKLSGNKTLTYGAFLRKRQVEGHSTRARPGAGDRGPLYEVYPTRELYEDEFNKIWDKQAGYYPGLMNGEIRKRVHRAIFWQRDLKPATRGHCAYLPKEFRTYRAMPGFQRYRMLQELNNLEWMAGGHRHRLVDHRAARDAVLRALETVSTRKGQLAWSKMKKIIKGLALAQGDFSFNFESPKRKGLDGNLTSNIMQREDYVGPAWHQWSLERQDEFIAVILDDELDDDEVELRLANEFHISEYAAKNCTNAQLVEGTANLSLNAARLLNRKMGDEMLGQADAVEAVSRENPDFINPFTRGSRDGLLDRLPYYGEAFQDGRHIIPGKRNPEDKDDDLKFFGGVTNPTVHIALNQVRQVVNELIDRYGRPCSIAVELGRELPAGQEERRRIENAQKRYQEDNKRLDERLRELGQVPGRDNRLRLLLWEELDQDDPNGRCCPFSGDKIGIVDLFNGNAGIEHLIPFSMSLDDSRANKVICTRQANRDKGRRTPYQAFGNSPGDYCWMEIAARVERLPEQKQWRFQKDALEIWNKGSDFSERHLNDTRYIGRLTREYLECICPFNKIDVVTGRLTALLRSHWGLNGILKDNTLSTEGRNTKTWDDHRYHAIDAIVVGMTTRSMLQKVSTAAARAEKLNLESLFQKTNSGTGSIDPWDNFRGNVLKVVRMITVSHKSRRKKLLHDNKMTDGQLHNETAYGIVSGPNKDGRCEVVVRWPITRFKTRKDLEDNNMGIRDLTLRGEFLQAYDAAVKAGEDGGKAIANLAEMKGIRSLRRTEKLTVIPVKDESGKIYKAYKGDSNWGMEIYEYPKTHTKAGRWVSVVISRFEAHQPGFNPGESRKPHPAARLIMRLQRDDCIQINDGNTKKILRLQKVNQNGQLSFAPLHEANVDARNRDSSDPFKFLLKQANALKPLNARKVHISPAGLVNYENRAGMRPQSCTWE